MKVIVRERYGGADVLALKDVDRPEPRKGEVLVKVRAASINAADRFLLKGRPLMLRFAGFGLIRPKIRILGADIAGTVESVGDEVSEFRPGDEVYGDLSGHGFGGFAEYACAGTLGFARKPAGITFEQAAAVPMAATTALQSLRHGGTGLTGKEVLINGAGGGVGSFAVQIAKAMGFRVTGVCSTRNLDLVRSLGADQVIDYSVQDFTANGHRYDLIIDAAAHRPLRHSIKALNQGGRYLVVGGDLTPLFQAMLLGPLLSSLRGVRVSAILAKSNVKDLDFLKDWLESRRVVPPIDRRYTLDQVPQAFREMEQAHARGKSVITI